MTLYQRYICTLLFCIGAYTTTAQQYPSADIRPISITYHSQTVQARLLTVRSVIPMPIDSAWQLVRTSALLHHVTKGKVKFYAHDFPAIWQEGDTCTTKMAVWGLFPFGKQHELYFDRIDTNRHQIQTLERDNGAKVWNHLITMEQRDESSIYYTDVVIIYGKWKTAFITTFAKSFYKHRQRRWQKLARQYSPPYYTA